MCVFVYVCVYFLYVHVFDVMFLHLFGLRESENVRLGKEQGLPIHKCPYLQICFLFLYVHIGPTYV